MAFSFGQRRTTAVISQSFFVISRILRIFVFSFIYFEFIEAWLIFFLTFIILGFSVSFKIFVLIDFDKFLFFLEIDFNISSLSEKNLTFLYSW